MFVFAAFDWGILTRIDAENADQSLIPLPHRLFIRVDSRQSASKNPGTVRHETVMSLDTIPTQPSP